MLLIEFLNQLAQKAGIAKDDKALEAINSNANLLTVQVDDKLAMAVNSSLLTVAAAKENDEIKTHFRATYFNGVDSRLMTALSELDYDQPTLDALKSKLESEKSTPEKAVLLAAEIKRLEREKATAALKGDKADKQAEIDRLHGMLADLKKQMKAELEAKDGTVAAMQLDYEMNSVLAGYNFAFPKEMPLKVKLQTAKALLTEAAKAKGAVIVNEDGALKLKKPDGGNYFDESHQPVDFTKFADGVFAQNKVLVATPEVKKTGGSGGIIVPGGGTLNTSRWSQAIDDSASSFEKGSKIAVE